MLQCSISVYEEKGKTFVGTLKPGVIADFYAEADIRALADEVDAIVLST